MNLRGKTILITGASEGLGKAIALCLAKEKAKIVLVARQKDKLEKVKKQIPGSLVISCDVTNHKAVSNMISEVIKNCGTLDVVVNCAGQWLKLKPADEASADEISAIIDVNLKGTINVTTCALPQLKKAPEAFIVNVSSHSGVKAKHHQSIYCAAKFGVRGFTETLKLELTKTNIKVVGFYPSGMNTQMFAKANETFSADEFMKTEDIANIVAFIIQQPKNICIEEIWVDKFSKRTVE